MPQMAPTNWLMLFLYFNMMLVFFSSINYFYPNNLVHTNTTLHQKNYNWMW